MRNDLDGLIIYIVFILWSVFCNEIFKEVMMIKYNANQGSVWMAEGLRSVLTDDSEKTDS